MLFGWLTALPDDIGHCVPRMPPWLLATRRLSSPTRRCRTRIVRRTDGVGPAMG